MQTDNQIHSKFILCDASMIDTIANVLLSNKDMVMEILKGDVRNEEQDAEFLKSEINYTKNVLQIPDNELNEEISEEYDNFKCGHEEYIKDEGEFEYYNLPHQEIEHSLNLSENTGNLELEDDTEMETGYQVHNKFTLYDTSMVDTIEDPLLVNEDVVSYILKSDPRKEEQVDEFLKYQIHDPENLLQIREYELNEEISEVHNNFIWGDEEFINANGELEYRNLSDQEIKHSRDLSGQRNMVSTTIEQLLQQPPTTPQHLHQLNIDGLKPILPRPHLSIDITDGQIFLMWDMPYNLNNYEDIAGYQLYHYDKMAETENSHTWLKTADVGALQLPIVYNLIPQERMVYIFVVCAIDVHQRMGEFSESTQLMVSI